ncbi:MAG: hypothetical protein FD181_2898 [Prolixibacteraceae bacterium]|nr:MAG: hypothetical protein FD181_2898 [Prolixibacteraceae bacterium]
MEPFMILLTAVFLLACNSKKPELTIGQCYQAARKIGIAQLAALKAEIGDLNKVERIVKVTGMMNVLRGFHNTQK